MYMPLYENNIASLITILKALRTFVFTLSCNFLESTSFVSELRSSTSHFNLPALVVGRSTFAGLDRLTADSTSFSLMKTTPSSSSSEVNTCSRSLASTMSGSLVKRMVWMKTGVVALAAEEEVVIDVGAVSIGAGLTVARL